MRLPGVQLRLPDSFGSHHVPLRSIAEVSDQVARGCASTSCLILSYTAGHNSKTGSERLPGVQEQLARTARQAPSVLVAFGSLSATIKS